MSFYAFFMTRQSNASPYLNFIAVASLVQDVIKKMTFRMAVRTQFRKISDVTQSCHKGRAISGPVRRLTISALIFYMYIIFNMAKLLLLLI